MVKSKKMKRRDGAVRNQPGLFDPPPKRKFNPIIKGFAFIQRTPEGGTKWVGTTSYKEK